MVKEKDRYVLWTGGERILVHARRFKDALMRNSAAYKL